jgi:pilus assembly protein CpaF
MEIVSGINQGMIGRETLKMIIEDKFIVNPEVLEPIYDELFGYGFIENLIKDPEITDIDIMSYDYLKYSKNGKKYTYLDPFNSEAEMIDYCRKVALKNLQVINESRPNVRFVDHGRKLRINITFPPRNNKGTSMFIRKMDIIKADLNVLREKNMLDNLSLRLIKDLILNFRSILIAGKSGAGKTTLLRAILNEYDEDTRIMIIEKTPELIQENRNFISYKLDEVNSLLNEVVREGLTLSVDGFCFGEIVGYEVWDVLKASFTGHKVFGTIHSGTGNELLDRFCTMISEKSPNINYNNINELVRNSLDIIIYVKDFKVIKMVSYSNFIEEVLYEIIQD